MPAERIPSEDNFWKRNSKPTSQRKLQKLADLYGVDVRALRTVMSKDRDFDYSDGQPRDGGVLVPPAELQHVVEVGLVPPERNYTDDQLIDWLLAEKAQVELPKLAQAFIIGVFRGRYDWRSALGSYACFVGLNEANRTETLARGMQGLPRHGQIDGGLLQLARYRFWKPYVIHDRVDYAAYDLWRFNQDTVREPVTEEADNFRCLLNAIRDLPESAKLGDLQKALTGLVKGDKYDRQHVLEILGYCDILGIPAGQPPMRSQYLDQQQRPLPQHFYSKEWRYPACFWNGGVGVNEAAVKFWFPGYER